MGCVFIKFCPCAKRSEILKSDELLEYESLSVDEKEIFGFKSLNEEVEIKISLARMTLERKCCPSEIYEKILYLGSGAFGRVCKVKHKLNGELRAMKIISKEFAIADCHQIEKEIEILKNLDHPNIIKVFEFFKDDLNYYIVTELCEQGDLLDKLTKMTKMNEIVVKMLMIQILSSVSYMHSKSVLHGDLKLENILIENLNFKHRMSFNSSIMKDLENLGKVNLHSSSKNDKQIENMSNLGNFEIKIIDFGCSRIFKKGKRKLSGIIGTSIYCAPEIINDKYDEKCDIWACGVIMYLLLSGRPPFEGESEEEIFVNILTKGLDLNSIPFDSVTSEAKDLISKLLTHDYKLRISANDALLHPFFKDSKHSIPNTDFSLLNRLKEIKCSFKFRQAFLALISHNFANREEVTKLRRLFTFLDSNCDGIISKEELTNGFKNFGENICLSQIESIFRAMDNDNSGCIEYEEFLRSLLDKTQLLSDFNLKMTFDLFKSDEFGRISLREIKNLLFGENERDSETLSEFFSEIKKSEEDFLTFEEFKSLILTGE